MPSSPLRRWPAGTGAQGRTSSFVRDAQGGLVAERIGPDEYYYASRCCGSTRRWPTEERIRLQPTSRVSISAEIAPCGPFVVSQPRFKDSPAA